MKKFNYYSFIVVCIIAILNTILSYPVDIKTIDTQLLKKLYSISSVFLILISFFNLIFVLKKEFNEWNFIIMYIAVNIWGLCLQFMTPSGYIVFISSSFIYSLFHNFGFKKLSGLLSLFGISYIYSIQNTLSLNKFSDLSEQLRFDYSSIVIIFCIVIISITFLKNKQLKEKELVENKLIDAGSRFSVFVHDLKNMTFPIVSNSNFLLKKEDANYKNVIENINTSVKDVNNFIINFNQSFSFKQEIKEIDFKKLVEELEQIYKNKLKTCKITVETDNSVLKCDEQIIKSILSNLMINSAEALNSVNPENPSIFIKYFKDTLTVSDNAGGMPKDKLTDLKNDVFFTTKSNGSGIGFFTIKNYAKIMNAKVNFENKDNGFQVSIKFK